MIMLNRFGITICFRFRLREKFQFYTVWVEGIYFTGSGVRGLFGCECGLWKDNKFSLIRSILIVFVLGPLLSGLPVGKVPVNHRFEFPDVLKEKFTNPIEC